MNQGEKGISTNILIGEQRGLSTIILLIVVIVGVLALSLIHPVKAQQDNGSVSLSLEPNEIRVPYMEKDDLISRNLVENMVELKIYNVSDLKEFHYELGYDSNVISFFTGSMDPYFYEATRGWRGGYFGGELARTFSGSAPMFFYTFKLLETGSTKIELTETELIDGGGSTIPHDTSGTTVEVVPLDEWVDDEYAALKSMFNQLKENFADLKESYENLSAEYRALTENHAGLEERYKNLSADYDSLIENRARLEERYENLSADYESLNENYLDLLSTYNDLLEDYESVLDNLDSVVRERDDLEGKVQSLQKSLTEKKAEIENMETELASIRDQLKEKKSEISQQSSEIESLKSRISAWQIGTGIAALIATLMVIFYIFKLRKMEE